MIRLVIRPTAKRELAEIWFHSADKWGVDQADLYISGLNRVIARALDYPDIGAKVECLGSDYRRLIVGSHRVIYRHTADELIVVRVLHERQDMPDELE